MGLLSFFGLNTDNKDATLQATSAARLACQNINVDHVVSSHIRWVTLLDDLVAGRSRERHDPVIIACDDRCELGKWIYSDGQKFLGQYAAFNDLKHTHQCFHQKAATIVDLNQSGRRDEARQELGGDIRKLSSKIRQRLLDLKTI